MATVVDVLLCFVNQPVTPKSTMNHDEDVPTGLIVFPVFESCASTLLLCFTVSGHTGWRHMGWDSSSYDRAAQYPLNMLDDSAPHRGAKQKAAARKSWWWMKYGEAVKGDFRIAANCF